MKDPEYNQYDCYERKMKERLQKKVKCLWPFQVHNRLNVSKDICHNMTEVDGKFV